MAKRNALKDVSPVAITICKKGANRQQIFLRKSTDTADLIALPAEHKLHKSKDWSTFYCVVAEPGAEEDPGMTGDADSIDVWTDPDEIRKACHRLLKNQGYVNAMHDAMAEEGCHIVENAIALADIDVEDPDGDVFTIKKDSWYVAIEPSEEFRKKVDDGEITGVSMEGTGVRVELEKSAVLKSATFNEVIVEREFQDNLWRVWSTLEGVIFDAFRDEDETDPKGVITTSIDQFRAYLLEKLDTVPAEGRAALAKELGSLHGTHPEEESEMAVADDIADIKKSLEPLPGTIDDLKKDSEANTEAVKGLVEITSKLVDREVKRDTDEPEVKVKKTGDDKVSLETIVEQIGKIADRMDDQDQALKKVATDVRTLGQGDTGQGDGDDVIRKATSDDPLAGLLT